MIRRATLSLILAMLAFIVLQAIRLPEVGAWKCEKHPEQPTCTTLPPVTVPNTTERTTVPTTSSTTSTTTASTTSTTSTTSTSLPPQSPPGETPPLKFAG